MGVRVLGGMWCDACGKPVSGQKSTNKFAKFSGTVLTGGNYIPGPGAFHCPHCGGPVRPRKNGDTVDPPTPRPVVAPRPTPTATQHPSTRQHASGTGEEKVLKSVPMQPTSDFPYNRARVTSRQLVLDNTTNSKVHYSVELLDILATRGNATVLSIDTVLGEVHLIVAAGDLMGLAGALSGARHRAAQEDNTPEVDETEPTTEASPAADGPPPDPSKEILSRLRELGDLKAAGVLTDDEFQTAKAALLQRL